MKPKRVTIQFDENGGATIDLAGFEGRGCAEILDALTKGDTVVESTNKPEYNQQFQRASQVQKVRQ